MKKFYVTARIEAKAHAIIEAESLEEAYRIVEDGDLDWIDEEWVAEPIPEVIEDGINEVTLFEPPFALGVWYGIPGTRLVIMVCKESDDRYGWRMASVKTKRAFVWWDVYTGAGPDSTVSRNYGVYATFEEASEAAHIAANQWVC